MSARWVVAEPDPNLQDRIASHLSVSRLTAQVLINRGITEPDEARRFLHPDLNDLADPDLLPGIEAAVERISAAARNKETVVIYGDFDVDGIAATAVLVRFLRIAGLDAEYYIPHRIDEGYGLNREAIAEFKEKGVGLIITVDCGVGAVEECELAREAGIDLIVTDHHEPGDAIAPACAVIDPKLTGSMYPFRDLAGVGVAFKLAWAVAKRFSIGQKMSEEFRSFLLNSLGLVALGTVADIVPLVGENRVLAKFGLKALGTTPGPGLRALMDCAGIRGDTLSARDIAFGLGPRLNAAGRMADASLAIRLMMCDDIMAGREIAQELDEHNIERRKVQNEIFQQAREMYLNGPDVKTARAIVLAHESWHAGVIGIVASKLVDDYSLPSVLIAIAGRVGKGSARSVCGFHLFKALEGFRDRMISFGGHQAAAGFQIAVEHIPALREHLNRAAASVDPEMFQPVVDVDAEVRLAEVDDHLVSELALLEPHGAGNPGPLFVAHDLYVAGRPRLMGMKGRHVSFYVRDGQTSLRAIAFGRGDDLYDRILAGERECSMVFTPRVDTWGGSGAVELRVFDIQLKGEE